MPTLFTMSATVHHNVCVSFGVRCPTMLDDDARSSLQLDISGFGKMQHTQMRRYRRDSIAICTNFGAYISMSEWMSEIYISGVYRLWLAFHVLCTFPWTKRYFICSKRNVHVKVDILPVLSGSQNMDYSQHFMLDFLMLELWHTSSIRTCEWKLPESVSILSVVAFIDRCWTLIPGEIVKYCSNHSK